MVPLAEDTLREIDGEIRQIIEEAYAEAEEIIERHASDVEAIAHALLETETLTGDQVASVIRQNSLTLA